MFDAIFLQSLVAGAVLAGIPLLLAGLGEQVSERSGVLNVGLEGMMLAGAFAGFFVALATGSVWAGLAAGAASGMAVAAIMAALTVGLSLNQIIVGIALTLGAEGITTMLHRALFSRTYPRLPAIETLAIPGLSGIPVIGPALFDQHPAVYMAVVLVTVQAWVFRGTFIGLNLQAAGDRPQALDAAGVSVGRTRALAVLYAGCMAGAGGAYMAVIGAGLFIPFMTSGAGFIGIVLAMLAAGRPLWVLAGSMVFGGSLSLITALQVAGTRIATDFVQMLPYVLVLLMLLLLSRRAVLPAALGLPYLRGTR